MGKFPTNDEEAKALEAELQAKLPQDTTVQVYVGRRLPTWRLVMYSLADAAVFVLIAGVASGVAAPAALGLAVLYGILRPVRLSLFPAIGNPWREV